MRTSKPISTISYNSSDFLKLKIEHWKKQGIIEYGMWIKHEAEQDEKKAHYHVFLKPAKLIQTMDLEQESCEIDPLNPDKPFKMVSFRVSQETDWLLYSIHDPAYLAEKGLSREFTYGFGDVLTTCEDTFQDIIAHCIDTRKGKLEYRLYEMIEKGLNWKEIVGSGVVPLRQINHAFTMYKALTGQANDYFHVKQETEETA